MSTLEEKTRALVWAGGFLVEVARDESLPLAVRRRAVTIARHFPTGGEAVLEANLALSRTSDSNLICHDQQRSWANDCKHGPLTYDTRLAWPE